MDGDRHDDPFLWDADAVARHLCSLKPPCTQEPTSLTAKIAMEGINGEILLTFDFVCAGSALCECLDIRLGCHQWSFGCALLKLRAASPAFRQWKKLNFETTSDESPSSKQPSETAKRQLDAPPVPSADTHAPGLDAAPLPGDKDAAYSTLAVERPSKRKRVAQVQLTDEVLDHPLLPLPTEADAFLGRGATLNAREQRDLLPWQHCSPHAYLGEAAITTSDIKAPDRLLTTQIMETGNSFATLYPFKIPPGLRLTISRTMKCHLLSTGRKEAQLQKGLIPTLSSTSQDSDQVLDLCDLPDSDNEELLRVIELDEAEQKNASKTIPTLESDRVIVLLQEAVAKIKAVWEENKLPIYRRKAYKLWTDATKRGTRTRQILQARQSAKNFERRLQELKKKILIQSFFKESEVQNQALSLEKSLEDRLYHEWLADTLESRVAPPKPESLPRLKPRSRKPQCPYGDEVLTSSDERTSSDENDFIVRDDKYDVVPDDVGGTVESSIMKDSVEPCGGDPFFVPKSEDEKAESSPMTPFKADSSLFVDLTQVETPQSLRRGSSVIDLTTPTMARSQSCIPSRCAGEDDNFPDSSVDPLESVEQIGKELPKHWAGLKDRPRLVICLIWRLPHVRRSHVLEAARDQDSNELFELSVTKQMREPLQDARLLDKGGPEATAFDLTRLFLCYIKLKSCKESRIMALCAADQKRLQAGQGEMWDEFLTLLKQNAHRFPQDSQIYRTDTMDDDMGDLEGVDDDELPDSPSQSRKNAPKEIVQNKEAVDLRERERRRVQEQEKRRLRLRAELDMSGSMPQDKSRLIINESKTEDQAFIYVNEGVGTRIKDHQVEGIRFMWNQVVTDANTSRGCLLAHSMGLGKTMQVITLLVAIQESAKSSDPAVKSQIPQDLQASKTLVLCPAGLVDNWMDELLRWAPDKMLGPLRKIESRQTWADRRSAILSWADEGGVLVLGYPMLQKVMAGDEEVGNKLLMEPNMVIADEAHTIKNPETKVHQACSRFETRCRIAMTGSPLANNVDEYYTMLDWVAPNFLGPLKEFQEIYATPIQQGMYKDSAGWEKRKALKQLKVLSITVAPKVNRRTTKMCAKDALPPKQEFVVCVPPTTMQRRLYNLYLTTLSEGCLSPTGANSLDHRLFAIAGDLALVVNHPNCFRRKMQMARDEGQGKEGNESKGLPETLISSAIKETNVQDLSNPRMSVKTELLLIILDEARAVREKVLVFSQSLLTLDYLENLLKWQKRQVCRLDGQTPIVKRQELVKSFNGGSQEVYLISTNAGGVGLNIQGANRVVIFDFKWNPVHEQQAVGRAYRIGQEKPVFVYRFVTAGTFEDDLQNRAVFKTQLASRVVDRQNPLSWSKKDCNIFHTVEEVKAQDLSGFLGKDRILDALIRHKSNNEAIRYIVSTDTFEEEDPDVGLTAQEQRQAEEEARMNHLRLSNPAEFERLKGQLQEAELQRACLMDGAAQQGQNSVQRGHATGWAPLAPHGSLGTGPPAWSFSATQQPRQVDSGPQRGTGMSSAVAVDGAHPVGASPAIRPNANATPPPSRPTTGATLVAAAAPLEQQAVAEQRQDGSKGEQATAPLPLAGANTYFGEKGADDGATVAETTAPLSVTGLKTPALDSTGRPTTPSLKRLFAPLGRTVAQTEFQEALRGEALRLLKEGLQAHKRPEILAKSVTTAIDRFRKEQTQGFPLDDQHWRLLRGFLLSPRFALSVVSGHLSPSFLGRADQAELERRVTVLNTLSEEEFNKQMSASWGRAPDPSV
ncbi:hypothetical protein XA68_10655 [Ophiocordyceps unilateralis]|uniref:Uncharacterized protein n=1 Tax=Ophiocordyceps unilateralis TaxID=268505 RepID=A0A2A9PGT2_OPHUN|nr:hypothetical protein XA68_10655 [Ophiocordyceps unilateralis]